METMVYAIIIVTENQLQTVTLENVILKWLMKAMLLQTAIFVCQIPFKVSSLFINTAFNITYFAHEDGR
jgi:hypothetical protein